MGFHAATRQSRTGISTLVLAVCALLLMGADSHFGWTQHIRSALLTALYPVQRAVSAPVLLTHTFGQEAWEYFQVHERNEDLEREIRQLRVAKQELEAMRRENDRLRRLLNEAQRLERQVSAAQIVAESPDPFHHTLTISRGERHGAFAGQPVISSQGAVGQVSTIAPLTAQIILLTDPNSATPVLVSSSRVRGILAGTGNKDLLELRYVPTSANVESGDQLVTSGLGGVFPKGLKAARVVEVVRDPRSPFAKVKARPAVPLSRLEDVLLLEREDKTEPGEQARQAGRSAP
ncbi:rod shape-determining protein MreC [Thiohalorhabdus sp.]|uniref:rod shape-determining protein MreC n=1 Tax=Thiohalorhabdus sp. TaxID=3094134 RepID=UPI002FC288C3